MLTGGRTRSRQSKETWRTTAKDLTAKDLAHVDVTWDECATVAADRSRWRQLTAAKCAKPHSSSNYYLRYDDNMDCRDGNEDRKYFSGMTWKWG